MSETTTLPTVAGPILEMRSITKEFPGVKALSDVSITVRSGEVHAICGENGAGKSTLMKVLSGGVYPYGSYDGEILLYGQEQRFKDIAASEHAGIVIIHQELALIPELSITENIFLGNEIRNGVAIDWAAQKARTIELLARVGLREDPDVAIKHLASASSSSSRSPRRSTRTSSSSSSTSRRQPSTRTTRSTCSI